MIATVLRRASPIVLQLDRATPFEALILNELERRPAARQGEWLRGLLVQGFQCECRALQVIEALGDATIETGVAIDVPAARPALATFNGAPVSASPPTSSDEAPDAGDAPATAPLAFAALRKVIG